jgi:hypothetical protein
MSNGSLVAVRSNGKTRERSRRNAYAVAVDLRGTVNRAVPAADGSVRRRRSEKVIAALQANAVCPPLTGSLR